jgi:hypothetical protein
VALEFPQNHRRACYNTDAGSGPRAFHLVGLGQGSSICIFAKFPTSPDATILGSPLRATALDLKDLTIKCIV